MSSPVAALDSALQTMLALKPPGVSQSKVSTITALCMEHIQSESVLVQKIYTHFKKAPATHKLGVLYVVDTVTRQWLERARKAGQAVGSTSGDGTYAAGVNRVTELMPVLMNDITQHAPEDQKDKIKKLVDIWERGTTFPAAMLQSFRDKLNAPPNVRSTTPPGPPPQNFQQANPPSAPAPNTTSILAALANIAKQNAQAPTTAQAVPQPNQNSVSTAQNAVPHQVQSSINQAPSYAVPGQAVSSAVGGASIPPQFAGLNFNGAAAQTTSLAPSNPVAALTSMLPQANPNPGGAEALQQQLVLIQLLMQQGIPQESWGPILAAVGTGQNAGTAGPPAAATAAAWQQPGAQNFWNDQSSRDLNGGSGEHMRSPPPRRHQDRSRSRSPPGGRRRDREVTPPRRRDSPIYGEYSGEAGSRRDVYGWRGRDGGRGRDNYRQRSPPDRRGRSSKSPDRYGPPTGGQKWVEYDPTIGKDNIKVLSRTLFVGGVTSSEAALRDVFSRFGTVQTCIVNAEKRHAFIKMISRADAVAAREGMETYRPPDMQLRTRWGVGFGPRDCSDYQTGVSVIPIERLTDADRKWMLTAEYGGSGGKPIEGGLVVEEPDIEIGAGVSSKAISRRMATDQGGRTGPRSSRTGPEPPRYRRPEAHDGGERESANSVGVPPAVPGFGFPFTLPNGMPMFPPGFALPAGLTQGQQPPAPGQG